MAKNDKPASAMMAAVIGGSVEIVAAPVAPLATKSDRQIEKMQAWDKSKGAADAKARAAEKALRESLKGIKRRAIDSTVGIAGFGFLRESAKQEKFGAYDDKFAAAAAEIGVKDPRSEILSVAGAECESLAKYLLGGE